MFGLGCVDFELSPSPKYQNIAITTVSGCIYKLSIGFTQGVNTSNPGFGFGKTVTLVVNESLPHRANGVILQNKRLHYHI